MGRPLNPPRTSGGISKHRTTTTLQALSTTLHQAARTLQSASTSSPPPPSLLNAAYRPILRAALTLHADFNATATHPITALPPTPTPLDPQLPPIRPDDLTRQRRQLHAASARIRHLQHRLLSDMERTAATHAYLNPAAPTPASDDPAPRPVRDGAARRRQRRQRELRERWLAETNATLTAAERELSSRASREDRRDDIELAPLAARESSEAQRMVRQLGRERDAIRELLARRR